MHPRKAININKQKVVWAIFEHIFVRQYLILNSFQFSKFSNQSMGNLYLLNKIKKKQTHATKTIKKKCRWP
jgi:hypothetical protein